MGNLQVRFLEGWAPAMAPGYSTLGITVAVGTTIADRPPHRSVLARLRIRLLRRMSGVEACIRIGMQNPGWWNPPVQDWGKSFPPHLGALAATDQNTLPEPAHAKLKASDQG